jgi:hypothetical protein
VENFDPGTSGCRSDQTIFVTTRIASIHHPESRPSVLPRWVNNYQQLNKNTIADSHPLPRIDDILNDCAKGKIWGTINMMNSFFQTPMEPSDIPLTVVSTPFRLFEWMVMLMGLKMHL